MVDNIPEIAGEMGRGPPPCQEPDCESDAIADTDHTYCGEHAGLEGETIEDDEPDDQDGDDPDDPDVAEVDLSDDDLSSGGNGLFSGTEDAEDDGDDLGLDDVDGSLDGMGSGPSAIETALNDGAARLATVGLGDDHDDLEDEFGEVFEAFQLGRFGAEFAEEYILVGDDEQIDPAWGLLGSAVCCMMVVLWMRPDGDEQIKRMQTTISNISGAA